MRYMLILLGLMFANVANAINCQELPDCESLGYSKKDDLNCADNGYMYCPFDQDYKVCVQYNCAALGFTESDKSSWCADLIKCKGNSQMTLCQKPCFATDAQSLAELASSGKCKVVTMKNDITIPLNESLTLAENTIIDGGGHTITSSGTQGVKLFGMNDKTGLKNINIRHTQPEKQYGLKIIYADVVTNTVSLENVDILISSNSDTKDWGNAIGPGVYNISGKFALDIQANGRVTALYPNTTMNFTDAQVSIKTTGKSGDFASKVTKTIFNNSTINADISGYYILLGSSLTLKNSKLNLKGNLFWSDGATPNLILEESSATLDLNNVNRHGTANITLKGSNEHPTTLKMTFKNEESDSYTNIITTNLTDTLEINGVTYRPKQAGTTKLSEIDGSENWQRQ